MAICALHLALGTSACTEPEPAPLPPNTAVIGKCAFTERATSDDIEPGEVFLYALRDDHNRDFSVVTGVAGTSDSLLDVVVRQSVTDVLLARQRSPDRLEFGGLAADRTGEADYFVAMGVRPGEVFTSIGSTWGTQIAYPTCVFWE